MDANAGLIRFANEHAAAVVVFLLVAVDTNENQHLICVRTDGILIELSLQHGRLRLLLIAHFSMS
jgi:hypothetical protein